MTPHSSAEAKYHATNYTAAEAQLLCQLFLDLGVGASAHMTLLR